jgi:hypothetical protein
MQWLLYVLIAVAFCSHDMLTCFVPMSEWTAIAALHSIKRQWMHVVLPVRYELNSCIL